MHSGGPVPKALHMRPWTKMGLSGKFVCNIWNGTLARTHVYLVQIVSVVSGALVVSVQLPKTTYICPKTTDISVSAKIVMSFATRIVACLICSFTSASLENIVFTWFSIPFCSKAALA